MFDRFRNHPHFRLYLSGGFALLILLYILFDALFPITVFGTKNPGTSGERSATSATRIVVDTDSDGDGLPDWKEQLYRTDMSLADTDGDGTKDGDEVLEARDPAIPGPNDRLSYLAGLEATTTSIDEARRKFLEEYLREASRKIQEDAFKGIVQQFDPSGLESRYELSDLIIDTRSGTGTFRTFGNNFGSLIERYVSRGIPSEDGIIEKMSKVKEDPQKAESVLRELELPAVNYRNFASDLAKIPVPLDLANDHLLIVNGYDVMSRALLDIKNLYGNPVQGAGAYQVYIKAKYDVTAGYAALLTWFSMADVVFAIDEPGALFTWLPEGVTVAPIDEGIEEIQ